jgi:hypothetical protein
MQDTMHGPTKTFADDPNVDRLFAMALALGAEISKLDEKLDSVLRLLEQSRVLTLAQVEQFQPDEADQARRDRARKDFIEALLGPFQQAADALVERLGT